MRCFVVSSGSLSLSPDGTVCSPSDLVVFTTAEADKMLSSPFNMTVEEGGQLGGAVLMVWAVAWGVRMIARILNTGDEASSEER